MEEANQRHHMTTMALSPTLLALLDSNEAPTQTQETFLTELLSSTSNRLLNETQRAAQEYTRSVCIKLLNPVRRLPQLVLREIFSNVVISSFYPLQLPPHRIRREVNDNYLTPWRLSQVSRYWRFTAFSHPFIWSFVYLYPRYSLYAQLPSQLSHTLETEYPLTVKLSAFNLFEGIPYALQGILFPTMGRWETLMVEECDLSLVRMIQSRTTNLSTLILSNVSDSSEPSSSYSTSRRTLRNPNQRKQLAVEQETRKDFPNLTTLACIPSMLFNYTAIPKSQITKYRVENTSTTLLEFRKILEVLPNLEQLELDVVPSCPIMSMQQPMDELSLEMLTHDKIKYLSLTSHMNPLLYLEKISLPNLESFSIAQRASYLPHPTPNMIQATTTPSLIDFICQSGCRRSLHTLDILLFIPNVDSFDDIVNLLPNLRSLTIPSTPISLALSSEVVENSSLTIVQMSIAHFILPIRRIVTDTSGREMVIGRNRMGDEVVMKILN